MLESALLRSPYARAKVRRIDLAAAAAAPGVLGVIGPGEVAGIEEEAHFEGAAVAGSRPRRWSRHGRHSS